MNSLYSRCLSLTVCASVLACSTGLRSVSTPPDGSDEVASDAGDAPTTETSSGLPDDEDPSDVPPALAALGLPLNAPPPPDVTNRFADDPAAARFGQTLFFDGLMSGRLLDGDNDGSPQAVGQQGETGRVSCASCHVPEGQFSDTRSLRKQISLGAGWGLRRAPSLLDVAHSPLLMWDGRRDTLYNQIFAVIENPVEMNSSRLFAAQQVFAKYRTEYEAIFEPMPPLDDHARFPALAAERTGCSKLEPASRACVGETHGSPGDSAEYDSMSPDDQQAITEVVVNVGKAIGAYERLLACGESRFDRWARKEDSTALSPAEIRGARLFVGKADCVRCHSGPYFSDEKFHNVGLQPQLVATVFIDLNDPGASVGLAQASDDALNSRGSYSDGDDGRLPRQVEPEKLGAFRTPKLRCLSSRPSFMHTAHIRTLSDVISFFDRGGDRVGFLGKSELAPLGLTSEERADLLAFLSSLDGPGPSNALLSR